MNRDELTSLQGQIDKAEQRVKDHHATIADLRARRMDTTDEEAVLHLMLSALVAMKQHREKVQAYVGLVERLKS